MASKGDTGAPDETGDGLMSALVVCMGSGMTYAGMHTFHLHAHIIYT